MATPKNLSTTARYTFDNGSQVTLQSRGYYRLGNAVWELKDRVKELCQDRGETFHENRMEYGVKTAGTLAGRGIGVVRDPDARP